MQGVGVATCPGGAGPRRAGVALPADVDPRPEGMGLLMFSADKASPEPRKPPVLPVGPR